MATSLGLGPEKSFTEHLQILKDMLIRGENFAFSRFSDGEIYMLQKKEIVMSPNGALVGDIKLPGNYPEDDWKHYDPEEHEFYRKKLEEDRKEAKAILDELAINCYHTRRPLRMIAAWAVQQHRCDPDKQAGSRRGVSSVHSRALHVDRRGALRRAGSAHPALAGQPHTWRSRELPSGCHVLDARPVCARRMGPWS